MSSPEGAHIVLDNFTINSETSIGFGQNGFIDLTLKNIGPLDSENILATLTTSDTYITSLTLNSEIAFGTIAGNSGTVASSENFYITVSESVPYGHVAHFELTMTDGTETWTAMLQIPILAPRLQIGSHTILNDTNANGILEAGETADISVEITNTGDADVFNLIAYLSTLSSDLILNLSEISQGGLAVGETVVVTFNISANEAVPAGTLATLSISAIAGESAQYETNSSFDIVIGIVPEYCTSGASFDYDTIVEKVSFGTLNNDTSGACATYSNFTDNEALRAVFELGTTHQLALTIGTCANDYPKMAKVFIDWNYDGDFTDSNETVFTSISATTTTFTATADVIIPADAAVGQRFMRIVCRETNTSSDITPCGTYDYGETEDYKIYLIPAATSGNEQLRQNSVTVFPNPTDGQINIETKSAGAQIEIYNLNGQLIHSALSVSTLTQIDLSSRAKGIYFVKVSDKNSVYNGKISVK